MTDKQVKLINRLTWLCAELYNGNEFSKEELWKWHIEARDELFRHGGTKTVVKQPL